MFGSIESVGTAGVFGQVMGLVAVTLCFFTLGSYLGREIAEGASLVCFIGGFGCILGLNFARRSEGLAITLLFAAGLLLGLGMGGRGQHLSVLPAAVWWGAGLAVTRRGEKAPAATCHAGTLGRGCEQRSPLFAPTAAWRPT